MDDQDDSLSAEQWEIGYLLATLLLWPSTWVHRRVESLTFLSDLTVQHRISVDYELANVASAKTLPYVPLAFLVKQPLVRFDLRDAADAALPFATSKQNRLITLSTLAALAEMVLLQRPSASLLNDLQTFVTAPDQDAGIESLISLRDKTPEARGVFGDSTFSSFARIFATRFPLLVPYPEKGARTITKFSYVEPIGTWNNPIGRPGIAGIPSSLAWAPLRFFFETGGSGADVSHHIEIETPTGLQVTDGECAVRPSQSAEPCTRRRIDTRIHFHVAEGINYSSRGEISLDLRPPRSGFVRGAFLSTLLVAVIMTVLAIDPARSSASEGSVSVLLVVPGILALLVARQGEHPLLSAVLLGLRFVVATSALLIFGVAFQIGTELPPICLSHLPITKLVGCRIHPTWWWPAVTSWVLFGLTIPPLILGRIDTENND